MAKKSTCAFCGSSQWGKNCPYSPINKTHMHIPTDSTTCVWCGSNKIGAGCPYNPSSRYHVRGLPYNELMKNNTEHEVTPEEALLQETLVTSYFLKRLFESFEDTQAFKLGVIDNNGRRLKIPQTIEEKASLTSLDVLVNQIKRTLGSKLDIIKNSFDLTVTTQEPINESIKLFEKKCKLGYKFKSALKEFNDLILESKKDGLSNDDIEQLIFKSFFE
ncbi:MAG: hypothetical protein WC554_17675 [Clostridia bacterium]